MDKGVDEFIKYLNENGVTRQDLEKANKRVYIFIDEIQYLANPSSLLKLLADHHRYLKVIVSRSSSFAIKDKFSNSLVGRTLNFEIYPLSFYEFLFFKDTPLQRTESYSSLTTDELKNLFREYLLYGAYPKIVLTGDLATKEKYLQQIIDTYIRKDIRDLAAIKNVDKFNHLLAVLASQSGNLVNVGELANSCNLARDTVENYLFLLEQTYVIKLVRPFSRNIRNELTKMPKVFFYDTGLMQMLIFKRLQREISGSVFETGIFSELIKEYGSQNIHYWRTQDKKEIDFILETPTGYLPIESKLQFPRSMPGVLGIFTEAYPIKQSTGADCRLVALDGTPSQKGMIYPWQL
jgi:hypothetical protein